jgi:2-dehydro-3-deoxygluconokinase
MAGTAPALSPVLRETTSEVAERVRGAGRLFALDVNYRAKLWSPQAAADYFATLLPLVSILFCGQRDAGRLFGAAGDPEAVARRLQDQFRIPTVVLTLGSGGAIAISDRVHRAPRVAHVTVVDPVGAGDAFAGGFLCGYLEGGVQRGLEIGSATGALHCTIPGDFAYVTRAEVEELLASDDDDIQR